MTTKKCILTDEPLSKENDSRAHIIPSALGGNIKPKGILSEKANSILNEKFDKPLIKALTPFMAHLGAIPDRGDVQPTKMSDKFGDEYFMNFGQPLKPTKPKLIKIQQSADKTVYEIESRTRKEAKNLIGKIKKNHPEIDIDIDSVVKNLQYKDTPVDGPLHQKLNLGPNIFFPSFFVMASLFAASNDMPIHPNFKLFVNDFDPTTLLDDSDLTSKKATIPPDTFYWIYPFEWFQVSSEVSHILILFGDSVRKKSIFYAELFNLPGVAVILPYDKASDVIYSYGIDVCNGEKIKIDLDVATFKSMEWESTHPWEIGKLDDFFSIAKNKVDNVIGIAQKRAAIHEINSLLEKKIGKIDNNQISSPEKRKQILDVISDYYVKKIIRSFESEMNDDKLRNTPDSLL
jgi:hypothetical protein